MCDGAGRGGTDVPDRGGAFEFVMSVVMKQVGDADRRARTRSFDDGKRGVIIDDIVGEQNFLPPAASHVQRRKIIERARSADTGEEPVVRRIPKTMLVGTAVAFRCRGPWSRARAVVRVTGGRCLRTRRR